MAYAQKRRALKRQMLLCLAEVALNGDLESWEAVLCKVDDLGLPYTTASSIADELADELER